MALPASISTLELLASSSTMKSCEAKVTVMVFGVLDAVERILDCVYVMLVPFKLVTAII